MMAPRSVVKVEFNAARGIGSAKGARPASMIGAAFLKNKETSCPSMVGAMLDGQGEICTPYASSSLGVVGRVVDAGLSPKAFSSGGDTAWPIAIPRTMVTTFATSGYLLGDMVGS